MPTTRQSTAVGAAKSAVEDNRLPPPAQPASKKAQVNRTTTSTPRKTRAGKKGSEAEERNRNVRSAEGSSAVLEPPVEPHSSDEADEAAGIPPNKSPIIQRHSKPPSPHRASGGVPQTPPRGTTNPCANHANDEGGEDLRVNNDDGPSKLPSPHRASSGVPPTPPRVPPKGATNPSANHADDEGGEDLRVNNDDAESDDGVPLLGRARMLNDSPSKEPVIESSPSHSDYSDTRKQLVQQRQRRARLGHATTDTEADDNDDDKELAEQVDLEPGLRDAPQAAVANSSNDKGKGKASLKTGRLSAHDKEEIRAFSTKVLEMAQDLADRLRISRKKVLISAGFGIKESRRENIANLHTQWYAATHTKPDGMSREDYARLISADYHKLVDDTTEEEKASNLRKVREWAAARDTVADEDLALKSITSRITSIREKFAGLSQSVENLYDIVVIGALIYVGSDVAGRQLSGLFTGSPVFRQLIDDNDVNVREILDRLTVAVKAPGVVAEGFNIPTFSNNEPPHELHQRQGESAKDRDRRAAGIIFRDSVVLFLPAYSNPKMNLPWKRWVELAAKEEVCMIGWEDGVMAPGPDFDIKKLGAGELRSLAGSYVDAILNGSDDYEAFSVIRWTPEQRTLPNTHPNKGLIPLVITRSGTYVRQLRDSHTWQKLVAQENKKAKRTVKQGHHVESEDGDDDLEEERDDDDDHDEMQSTTALKRGRSLNEDVAQSRPQPKRSKTDANNRQRSIQLGGTSDVEASRARPPPQPTARINVPRQQSIRRGGTPVDPRAHEALPNNRKWSVVPSTRRPSPSQSPTRHDSFLRPSTSHNSTQLGSSQAGTRYNHPPTRPRLPPPSSNFRRPRPATAQHNTEWSDGDNMQFGTLLRPHRIETRGPFIPRAETDSRHPRDSRAIGLQQSYDIPPRASTSQGHAAHSIPQSSPHASMPSTTQRHHPTGYHRPSLHRSLRSREHYRGMRASTIEEEDVQMGGQPIYPGQYSGYRQDYYSDGGYFDDTYRGEEQSEEVIDEYDEE